MNFTLSAHAQTILVERAINTEWIEHTLSSPERIENDKDDPALKHALGRIPENGNRVLRVVYNGSVEPVRVITAYFDRALRSKL